MNRAALLSLSHDDLIALVQAQHAQIEAQVTGYLVRQNYREGAFVHKGDVLFEIDARPFQAVLDQAAGQLSQARAQLEQANGKAEQDEAQLQLARINVRRDTPLAAAKAVQQSQLDTETQTLTTNEALLKTDRAAVKASLRRRTVAPGSAPSFSSLAEVASSSSFSRSSWALATSS